MTSHASVKLCKKCNHIFAVEQFSSNRRTKDGLQAWCKTCSVVAVQEHKARHSAPHRRPKTQAPEKPKPIHTINAYPDIPLSRLMGRR